jgi:hypothetical protein
LGFFNTAEVVRGTTMPAVHQAQGTSGILPKKQGRHLLTARHPGCQLADTLSGEEGAVA